MATKNITGLNDESIVVSTSGNTYNIAKNATVIATGGDPSSMSGDLAAAIMEDMTATPHPKNNIYNVDGRVIGYSAGIFVGGNNDQVHIGDTGKVTGTYGVGMLGNNTRFSNDGDITSVGGFGVIGSTGTGQQFRNDGSIYGAGGMVSEAGDKVLMFNGEHGDILALQYGVAIISSTGQTGKFINHGSVTMTFTEGFAFAGGDGNETVINDGKLKGHVMLGDGDDRIDNRGGTIQGTIIGGGGDDVLITDKAGDKLFEESGGGNDIVKSSASYKLSANVENLTLFGKANINGTGNIEANVMHGNNANNTLRGLAGADELFGGKGNDVLTGGADADVFHFAKGDGKDTITDFTTMSDTIDLSKWTGIDDLADVTSHAHNKGEDVLITSGTDSLLIKHMHVADLVDGNFQF